jgi:hypothetical protein
MRNTDRRNALGELEIKVWDMLDKKKEIFMGEVRLSLGTVHLQHQTWPTTRSPGEVSPTGRGAMPQVTMVA